MDEHQGSCAFGAPDDEQRSWQVPEMAPVRPMTDARRVPSRDAQADLIEAPIEDNIAGQHAGAYAGTNRAPLRRSR